MSAMPLRFSAATVPAGADSVPPPPPPDPSHAHDPAPATTHQLHRQTPANQPPHNAAVIAPTESESESTDTARHNPSNRAPRTVASSASAGRLFTASAAHQRATPNSSGAVQPVPKCSATASGTGTVPPSSSSTARLSAAAVREASPGIESSAATEPHHDSTRRAASNNASNEPDWDANKSRTNNAYAAAEANASGCPCVNAAARTANKTTVRSCATGKTPNAAERTNAPLPKASGFNDFDTNCISPEPNARNVAAPGPRRAVNSEDPSISRSNENGADSGRTSPIPRNHRKYANHKHANSSAAAPSLFHSKTSVKASSVKHVSCVSSLTSSSPNAESHGLGALSAICSADNNSNG